MQVGIGTARRSLKSSCPVRHAALGSRHADPESCISAATASSGGSPMEARTSDPGRRAAAGEPNGLIADLV
jgi:hypothetical protein